MKKKRDSIRFSIRVTLNYFFETISEQRRGYNRTSGYLQKSTNWPRTTFILCRRQKSRNGSRFLARSPSLSSQWQTSYSSSVGFFSSDPALRSITIHGEERDRSRKNRTQTQCSCISFNRNVSSQRVFIQKIYFFSKYIDWGL